MRTSSFLRTTTCALAATLVLTACNDGGTASTAPTSGTAMLAAQNAATTDTARALMTPPPPPTAAQAAGSVTGGEFGAWPFPASLALTGAQQTQIRALRTAHEDAVRADMAALTAIQNEAAVARAGGATREAVNAILQKGMPLTEKLAEANRALGQQIEQLFTEAQRKWLADWRACMSFSPTPEQAAQVAALHAAYAKDNAADLAAIQKALDSITLIRAGGGTPEAIETQIRTLLDGIRQTRERLRGAQEALAKQIDGIYTRPTCQ